MLSEESGTDSRELTQKVHIWIHFLNKGSQIGEVFNEQHELLGNPSATSKELFQKRLELRNELLFC